MTVKKIVGKLHLWLGLTSGLVVFIIAITGCLYAFKQEIENITQPYRFIEIQHIPKMLPSQLIDVAQNQLPGKHIHAVLYSSGHKSAQVIFYNYQPEYYYYIVFVNPYSGQVLKVQNTGTTFFQFILNGHFYLWLPPAIGQPVVAISTFIFLVMIITGMVLWWPSKKNRQQKFKVQWKSRWRRKNYDLHSVLGFYAATLLVILSCTGLVWGFQWFASASYAISGGKKSLLYEEPISSNTSVRLSRHSAIDKVWIEMNKQHPLAEIIEVHIPETPTGSIAANSNTENGTYWKTDYQYFDQHTIKEISVNHIYGRIANANNADKLIRLNYDIHTGAVFGLAGKVLAFCASLVAASLPVTGFLLWYGRNFKSRKKITG